MKLKLRVMTTLLVATCAGAVAAPPVSVIALSDEASPTGQDYGPISHKPRFATDGRVYFPTQRGMFVYEMGVGTSVLIPPNEPVAPGIAYSPNSDEFTADAKGRVMTLGGLFGSNPGLTFGTAGNLLLVAAQGSLAPSPFETSQFSSISLARMTDDGTIVFAASVAGESTLWLSVAGQTPVLLASETQGGALVRPEGLLSVQSADLAISVAGDIVWGGTVDVDGVSRQCILHSDESGTTVLLSLGDEFEDGAFAASQLIFPVQLNDDSIISIAFETDQGSDESLGTRMLYGTPAQFVPNTGALTTARGGRVLTSSGVAYSVGPNQEDLLDLRRFNGDGEQILLVQGESFGEHGNALAENLGDATANARGDVAFQCWVDRPDAARAFALMHYHDNFGVRPILFRGQALEVRPGELRQVTNWSYLRNTGGVGGENSGLSEDGRFAFRVEFANGTTGIAVADLTAVAPCPADFAEPIGIVDFFDLQAYLSLYSAGSLDADISPSPAGDGILTFFDVLEFLNRFSIGCP